MCDCIEIIEKKLNDKMIEENPGCEIIEKVRLENQAIMLNTGRYQLYSPALGIFMQGKRKRKFALNMYYSFCPFCGEKYDKK